MHKNVVAQIRKATRKKYSAGEKIRIVLEGLRGENPILRDVPPGGDRPDDVLPVVEGVPGGGVGRLSRSTTDGGITRRWTT
jgi:hypothetical protein